MNKNEVTLVTAAARLRVSWHTAYRLVLTGELEGRQDQGRRLCAQTQGTLPGPVSGLAGNGGRVRARGAA